MRFEKKFICEDLLNLQIKTFINRLEEEKHDYLKGFEINSTVQFLSIFICMYLYKEIVKRSKVTNVDQLYFKAKSFIITISPFNRHMQSKLK
jgi:hypothetical protein